MSLVPSCSAALFALGPVLLAIEGAAQASPALLASEAHPWSLGARAAVWDAGYLAPGVGGHVRYRPTRRLGVEAFGNSFAVQQQQRLLHDHVVGFHAFVPAVGGETWFVAPAAGMCVDFRFQTDRSHASPSTGDIRFGLHSGLIVEKQLTERFSAEVNGAVFGYAGNGAGVDGWTATQSTSLKLSAVTQLTTAINVRL